MQVRDEYKCRRCGYVYRTDPIELAEGDLLVDHVIDRFATTGDIEDQFHSCHYGGVGVGDWIGSVEVKEATDG